MKRVTLSSSASLEYFGEIIKNYCEILEEIDKLRISLNKIKDHEDMRGGIISYVNVILEQTSKMNDFELNSLSNLYMFMSRYYTSIGNDLYTSWKAAENDVKYSNSMKKYFYNSNDSIPIANAIADPYKLPGKDGDYSLVNVALGEDGSIGQAYKKYYGNEDGIRHDYAEKALEEYGDQEKSVLAYGLMETSKQNLDEISKDTGVSVDDIVAFNVASGRMEILDNGQRGFKSNTLLVPAYKSDNPEIRTATYSNGLYQEISTIQNNGGN